MEKVLVFNTKTAAEALTKEENETLQKLYSKIEKHIDNQKRGQKNV